MEVVLLHNAKAGDENWSRRKLVKLVRRAGFTPRYHSLKMAIARPELFDRGEFVIVAGGDGSIRSAAMAMLGRGRPLAPLPLGTANNIVRSFGLPSEPEEIVDGWRHAQHRRFDVGVVKGPWGKRHFIEGVGLGLISRCMAVLDDIDETAVYSLKKAKHKLHRDVCVAAALAHEMQPLHARLAYDGRDASNEFLLMEVLNIRRAGPGVELAPTANPCDGYFDLVTATANQRPRLLKTLKARLKDSTNRVNRIHSLTSRRVRDVQLKVSEACQMRVDDASISLAAGSSLEIAIKPGELEFVLPGKR